jgi:hypothetical protein
MLTTTLNPQGCAFAAVPGMDPFADWLLGPGIHDFSGGERALAGPLPRPVRRSLRAGGLEEAVLLPRFGKSYEQRLAAGAVMTAFAPPEFHGSSCWRTRTSRTARCARHGRSSRSARRSGSADLRRGGLARGAQQQPVEEPDIGPPEDGWPDGTVIMGVIDDGIAFANDRFRRKDGSSRVECFWQQGLTRRSATVPFGQELLRADIDILLQRWTTGGRSTRLRSMPRRARQLCRARAQGGSTAGGARHACARPRGRCRAGPPTMPAADHRRRAADPCGGGHLVPAARPGDQRGGRVHRRPGAEARRRRPPLPVVICDQLRHACRAA